LEKLIPIIPTASKANVAGSGTELPSKDWLKSPMPSALPANMNLELSILF
jgi:hypothetical protein